MVQQLLYKSTPTLEVPTVAFKSLPYAGGTKSCFLHQLPTLKVQTVAFYITFLAKQISLRYEKNESNKSKKEARAQRKKQKYGEITIKKDNRHQHGQAMGEEVTHLQMSRWSKHIDAGSEQQ